MVAERRFKSDLKTEMSRETDMLRTERLELTKANALIGLNLEIPEPETDSDRSVGTLFKRFKGRRRFGREEWIGLCTPPTIQRVERGPKSWDERVTARSDFSGPPSAEGSPLCCDPIPNPPEPPTPKLPVFRLQGRSQQLITPPKSVPRKRMLFLSITHKLDSIMMPSSMSVSRDKPLHMTVLPGGGSWARAR